MSHTLDLQPLRSLPRSPHTPTTREQTLVLRVTTFGGLVLEHRLPDGGSVVVTHPRGSQEFRAEELLIIDDDAISVQHARFSAIDGRLRIEDLGSRNGVWIGGTRVERGELSSGSVVHLGRSTFELVDQPTETERRTNDAGLVGASRAMKRLRLEVAALAKLSGSLLIRGESGSGKEVVARAIHQLSARSKGPFEAVNLGALPSELAEAELFGVERGAFTGAKESRAGYFERADGGTLLLDELGELPLELQCKLLRVLETRMVRRVGGRQERAFDVRVIAATWADLESRVEQGTFREDLFHRIAVLVVELPPLRERLEDLPLLASHLLARVAHEVRGRRLSEGGLECLKRQSFRGNVRELANVLYRAAANSTTEVIDQAEVERALRSSRKSAPPGSSQVSLARSRGLAASKLRSADATLRGEDWGLRPRSEEDSPQSARLEDSARSPRSEDSARSPRSMTRSGYCIEELRREVSNRYRTVAEAARHLGVPRETLRDWMRGPKKPEP